MTSKLNEIFYERFDSQERFNLAFAARIRGDREEEKRLYETCPRYTYRSCDNAFTKRMDLVQEIAMFVTVQMQHFYHKVLMCDLALTMYGMAYEGDIQQSHILQLLELSDPEEDTKIVSLIKIKKILENRKYALTQLKAIQQALIEFCNEVGIHQEQMKKWLGLELLCYRIEVYLSEETEPDKEFAVLLKMKFLEVWRLELG